MWLVACLPSGLLACCGAWLLGFKTRPGQRQTAAAALLLQIHDPTTPNRQGADVGPQYRSIILYTSEQQKETAKQVGGRVGCPAIRLLGRAWQPDVEESQEP